MKMTNQAANLLLRWQFTEGRRARATWIDRGPGASRTSFPMSRFETVDVNRRLI